MSGFVVSISDLLPAVLWRAEALNYPDEWEKGSLTMQHWSHVSVTCFKTEKCRASSRNHNSPGPTKSDTKPEILSKKGKLGGKQKWEKAKVPASVQKDTGEASMPAMTVSWREFVKEKARRQGKKDRKAVTSILGMTVSFLTSLCWFPCQLQLTSTSIVFSICCLGYLLRNEQIDYPIFFSFSSSTSQREKLILSLSFTSCLRGLASRSVCKYLHSVFGCHQFFLIKF